MNRTKETVAAHPKDFLLPAQAGTDGAGAANRYGEVRRLTERLAEPLSPEDQTVQSMPDVSPTKGPPRN